MLYYRSKRQPRQLSLPLVRLLTLGSLIAYPAGALVVRFGDGLASTLVGYGLIAAALFGVIAIMDSSIQRIVGEEQAKLDEYELRLRACALSAAFTGISALFLIATVYLAIAADIGAWVPSTHDEFNAAFWGIFLWATLLPTLCLSFQLDPSDIASEG